MNNPKTRKPRKRGSSVWQMVLLIFLSLVIVTAVFAGGYVIRSILIKPKPGGDGKSTLYTGAGDGRETADEMTAEGEKPDMLGDKTDGYTRRADVYNFLLIGRDAVANNTDLIILASFDCGAGKISMCQLPRDTYAEFGDNYGKINKAYKVFYAQAQRNGAADPSKAALDSFADLFEKSFNIPIDYYIMINLSGFKAVVDRIGGVDMYVPYDMNYEDPEQNLYIHLKKGQQTLTGEKAEGFVRFRSGYIQADIARVDAQKMFITAFIAKVKASISVPMIAGVAADILPNLTTNLQSSDCIYFANKTLGVDMNKITMMTMPGESYDEGRTRGIYYIMHRDDMLKLVNTYLNVYDKPIPSSYFDVDRTFVKDDNAVIVSHYKASTGEIVTYNAGDVEENGIDIDLY